MLLVSLYCGSKGICDVYFSEYARPHAGFSPGGMPRTAGPVLGLPPQCMDPMLHYQLSSMYGPGARER
jgi:arginine-glutamic acid dipeptide repeat-containing protein